MNQTPSMPGTPWQPSDLERDVLYRLVGGSDLYVKLRRLATEENSGASMVFSHSVSMLAEMMLSYRKTIQRELDMMVGCGLLGLLSPGNRRISARYQINEVEQAHQFEEVSEDCLLAMVRFWGHSAPKDVDLWVHFAPKIMGYAGHLWSRFAPKADDAGNLWVQNDPKDENLWVQNDPKAEPVWVQNDPKDENLWVQNDPKAVSPPSPPPHENAVPDGAEPPSLAGARTRVPARSSKRLKELELGEILDQVQKIGQPNFNGTEAKPAAQVKPFAGQPGVTLEADATGVPSKTPSRFNVSITTDGEEIIAEGPGVDERATWTGRTGAADVRRYADELITETLALTDADQLDRRHNASSGKLAMEKPLGQLWGERIRSLGEYLNRPMLPIFPDRPEGVVKGFAAYWQVLTLNGLRGEAGPKFSWPNRLTALIEDRRYASIFPLAAGTPDLLARDKSLLILAAEYVAFLDQDPYECGDDKAFRESDYAAANRRQLTDAQHAVTYLRPKQGKPEELVKLVKFTRYLDARALDPFYADAHEVRAAQANYESPDFPVTAPSGLYVVARPAIRDGREVGVKFRLAEIASSNPERVEGRIQARLFDREWSKSAGVSVDLTPSAWAAMQPELIPANSAVITLINTPGLTAEAYSREMNRLCPPQLHPQEMNP